MSLLLKRQVSFTEEFVDHLGKYLYNHLVLFFSLHLPPHFFNLPLSSDCYAFYDIWAKKERNNSFYNQVGRCKGKTYLYNFYWTQVYLGSDLWVQVSLSE